MMIFALGALAFGGVTGWMLGSAIRDAKPVSVKDWATDIALGAGALCVMVTSIKVLVS